MEKILYNIFVIVGSVLIGALLMKGYDRANPTCPSCGEPIVKGTSTTVNYKNYAGEVGDRDNLISMASITLCGDCRIKAGMNKLGGDFILIKDPYLPGVHEPAKDPK